MNKRQLANKVATSVPGITQAQTLQVVDRYFMCMKDTLLTGKQLKISGLGTFNLRHKKARLGRNPRTGEQVTIMERIVAVFCISAKLRKKINEYL